ncbi:MAG: hypothetical protein ACTSVL_03260, partial [Promethearchaeota archaeon]
MLKSNNFVCMPFMEFPIAKQNIDPFDILVFACPDNSRISRNEIKSISAWVKNGGGLLLLSHAGGDRGRRSNLSELAEQFGMIFENDQVLDKVHNFGVENLPLINNFSILHPITENISEICYRAGSSLSSTGMANTPVVSSSDDADPPSVPLILAKEYGEGRVVAIGSYEMFRDKNVGGIKHPDHSKLALNIFSW